METVIGMVLAFVLGAYIRQPFKVYEKHPEEPKESIDKDIEEYMIEESKREQERQFQIFKALNWNGGKDYDE